MPVLSPPSRIAMRLSILILATVAIVASTATVLSQELQADIPAPVVNSLSVPPPGYIPFQPALPTSTLPEVPSPSFSPAEYATPPAAPIDASQPGFVSPVIGRPQNEGSTMSGMDGSEMGGRGMGGLSIGGPGAGGSGYGATWFPSRPVSASNPQEDFGLVRQSLSESFPVWRNGGDMLMLSASVRNSMFFTDAILPDSHEPFPSELWNISLGSNYLHKFDNGWSGMVGVNFGSASDKPFYSINEMNIGFMSFLNIPVWNDRDAWRLMLMYSPVGNFNFPIPGVAYQWNPSTPSMLPLVCRFRSCGDLSMT